MKETKIQNSILSHLRSKGVFCFRVNNGSIWDKKLGMYRTHSSIKGIPDIFAVKDSLFYGIEVKSEKGKMSADQFLFKKRFEEAGGKYILARNKEDVVILSKKM